MNFILNVCFILVIPSFGSASRINVSEGRIIGGHQAKPYSHPYLVSLQLKFLWMRMHICGGTILSEKWVLTAAHCIVESFFTRWLPIDVVAGAHDVNNFGRKAQVSTIDRRIPHPEYYGGIGPNDIALLRTRIPFSFTKEVQPINLPYNLKEDSSSSPLSLTGWGALRTTVFIPDLPSTLQEVQVKYITYEECYKAIDDIKDDSESNPLNKNANVCTGPLTGGIAACSGDSGGPLIQVISENDTTDENDPIKDEFYEDDEYIENNNNINHKIDDGDTPPRPVILGIVSWGISPCGEKGAPTVYTKVSPYIDFINKHIQYNN